LRADYTGSEAQAGDTLRTNTARHHTRPSRRSDDIPKAQPGTG